VKYTRIGDTDCSIAQALDVVGDWWTLLVVRRRRHALLGPGR
jgi:DNA-binding HxlR family transcriptional regulator